MVDSSPYLKASDSTLLTIVRVYKLYLITYLLTYYMCLSHIYVFVTYGCGLDSVEDQLGTSEGDD